MEWRRHPGSDLSDPNGVADLLARACAQHPGREPAAGVTPIEGTRFLFRTSDMLAVSREIEQLALLNPGERLLVGVQTADRLVRQADVYHELVRADVQVTAFGTDAGPGLPGIDWVRVPADTHALSAQWFLVRPGPRPRALVGFELGRDADRRRRWEGFTSSDPQLVQRLSAHLDEVARLVAA